MRNRDVFVTLAVLLVLAQLQLSGTADQRFAVEELKTGIAENPTTFGLSIDEALNYTDDRFYWITADRVDRVLAAEGYANLRDHVRVAYAFVREGPRPLRQVYVVGWIVNDPLKLQGCQHTWFFLDAAATNLTPDSHP
jgi:hypothetical protein